jgi:hypothetical protein
MEKPSHRHLLGMNFRAAKYQMVRQITSFVPNLNDNLNDNLNRSPILEL